MALDEALVIHERLLEALGAFITSSSGDSPAGLWALPGAAIAVVAIVAARQLGLATGLYARRGILCAAIVFFLGAIVFEVLSLRSPDATSNGPIYTAANLVEEGLEFAGVAIAVLTALRVLRVTTASETGPDTRRHQEGSDPISTVSSG